MRRDFGIAPRIAIFLAGVAAGALSGRSRGRSDSDGQAVQDLKRSVADLEARVAAHESGNAARFGEVRKQLQEHASKLAQIPTTAQIVDAMEQLLSRTMSSLDERLTTQAHSIEMLKTTVSQTDSLLERVLESLDSLQTYNDPELAASGVGPRPAA